jgi:cytidylate kinase
MPRLTGGPADLVERQMRMYHALQKAQGEPRAAAPGAPEQTPFVTISRQHGANGSAIAAKVAEILGWTVYDRNLLEAIAQDAHLQDQLLEPFDERRRTQMEDWVSHLMGLQSLSEVAYHRSLFRVLSSIGHVGRAVIVGRGAHLVLPPEHGLRVRIEAPLATRIEWAMEHDHLKRSDAEAHIAKTDRLRDEWLRRTFGPRAGRVEEAFDLMLNSSAFGEVVAAKVIVRALEAKCGVQIKWRRLNAA